MRRAADRARTGSIRAAAVSLVLAFAWASAAAAEPPYRTVVVFGDTQHLVWNGRPSDYAKFVVMVDWVIANREAENIDFVLHVGDAIQNGYRTSYPLDPAACAGAVADASADHFLDGLPLERPARRRGLPDG
ncbi:MAG: metallophosphoesterase [Deltaproteobacteria bacterium]|nr:metallophosphoesterase [Deltaproteobacteria bacterium]